LPLRPIFQRVGFDGDAGRALTHDAARATDLVNQTLPPIALPAPMVMRPRMVAPA
jgi:hypothetical protein